MHWSYKQPLPTTEEKTLYMDITRWSTPKSDWLYSLQPKMEKLYAAAAAAKSLQSCPTLCNPIDVWQPTRFPCPWDSPGKNTGVGCHFLLQRMKGKSESEVAQSCLTPSDPMDWSLPGSSIHGIFQARVLEWGAIAFSGRSSIQSAKKRPGADWGSDHELLIAKFRLKLKK